MKKATPLTLSAPEGDSAERLQAITRRAAASARAGGHKPPALIAICKTADADAIRPLLIAGHRLFGENRVQEAQAKWPALRAEFPDVELHMVGQLQSNKAAEAVQLFDAIHSVDRPSLIAALARAIAGSGRRPTLFIQVNLAGETQKGGVTVEDLPALLERAADAGLTISGLMTVPPADQEPSPWFALLAKLSRRHKLPLLSMGMSGDYDIAAALGATHIRIGSALFK
ncbi:MAG: YggS family pyridoxal phosphate-dependent enzyme [Sphingomonadaceae bacterium]